MQLSELTIVTDVSWNHGILAVTEQPIAFIALPESTPEPIWTVEECPDDE